MKHRYSCSAAMTHGSLTHDPRNHAMHEHRFIFSTLVCVVALAFGSVSALAQTPPAKEPPKTDTPKKDAPRSLDDLLGVPGAKASDKSGDKPASDATSAEDAAAREQKRRLERSLDEATLQDLVARAVEGMKTASDRLTDAKDPGLGTQRVQEEVVRTLDRLLEEAQKQQGKKKSSSSSSSSKQKKEGEKSQDPSEKNGQQQKPSKSQQQQQNDASKSGENNESANNQTRGDEVAQGGELSESRIEWGKLPERVRELVLQGRRDRVSSIYERLTREYYRRLAEEASR